MEEVPKQLSGENTATEVYICINARSTVFAIHKMNFKL